MTSLLERFDREFAGKDLDEPAVQAEIFEWVLANLDETYEAVMSTLISPELRSRLHSLDDLLS